MSTTSTNFYEILRILLVLGVGGEVTNFNKILRKSKNSTGLGGGGEVTNFYKTLQNSKNSTGFGGGGVRSLTSTKFYEFLRILLVSRVEG